MVKIKTLEEENRAGKKGKKGAGRVWGESIETDRQQKKEPSFFIITEGLVLTLLTHPGDQELFLGKLGIESLDFPVAGHADMLLHLWDSVWKEQVSGPWLDAGRVRDRELIAHAATSERELCDGFFDICNPASQVRFYIRILDISILAFMASFAVWISLALGKYLNCLSCQPQDVAVIRFDFKFHIIHTPSAQADNSRKLWLFKQVRQQKNKHFRRQVASSHPRSRKN
jgi:hypothetical protein